jgi:4,5-dihydroxyphthalate decarboxylase
MAFVLRLAVRDWDFITPLLLGDVCSDRFTLELHRVNALVNDLAGDARYDGGETSLSRYTQGRMRGETAMLGIPYFIMRAFRQRCIITAQDSPLTRLDQLAGKKIGLTGWQDSGNVWTRALTRAAGVGLDDANWYVGRLTADHPIIDRLNGFGEPGRIEAVPEEAPMVECLRDGRLDAIFTPFMPPGFFAADSGLRTLQPDSRAAELAYFAQTGYVPGIHLLTLKAAVVAEHPWLPEALAELFAESKRVWLEKRVKYADTTPWLLEELGRSLRDLPDSWEQSGFEANLPMLEGFCEELFAQRITPQRLDPKIIFPSTF